MLICRKFHKKIFGACHIKPLCMYVVDYRYWTGSISKLAQDKKVNDVLFLNNLSMIRNKSLVGKLYRYHLFGHSDSFQPVQNIGFRFADTVTGNCITIQYGGFRQVLQVPHL